MDCNWKLDGQPMGLLKADNSEVVPVSSGEHLIQAATTDGVVKIRIKVEVDQSQNTVEIRLRSRHDQKLKMQQAETARKQAEAALHPTWTDPDTGLMWTKNDNGSNVNWNQATDYCTKLQLAGYNDWRLPTIEELQGIYDPNVTLKKVFEMGTFDVHVKGNLNLTGWHWSSSQGDSPGEPHQVAWQLNFGGNGVRHSFPLEFSYDSRALCVRHFGERTE
jgi:hypothetical protein